MKQSALILSSVALMVAACGEKPAPPPPEPAETQAPAVAPPATEAPAEITATDCAVFSESYPLNFADGSIMPTEGTVGALDDEFAKLLPMATTCGNVLITLHQVVADIDGMALADARSEAILNLLNQEYDVPLYHLDSKTEMADESETNSVTLDVRFDDAP